MRKLISVLPALILLAVSVSADCYGSSYSDIPKSESITIKRCSETGKLSYPIVDTGQTNCYDTRAEISPPRPGQPFYGQDSQYAGAQPSYTLSSDGKTVLDNITRLTWMRGPNVDLSSPVADDKMTNAQALDYVKAVNASNYAGYNDWRLPSIKELYCLYIEIE